MPKKRAESSNKINSSGKSERSKSDLHLSLSRTQSSTSDFKPSPVKSHFFPSPVLSNSIDAVSASKQNLHNEKTKKGHLDTHSNTSSSQISITPKTFSDEFSASNVDISLAEFLEKELNIHVENLHALSTKHDRDRLEKKFQMNDNLKLEELLIPQYAPNATSLSSSSKVRRGSFIQSPTLNTLPIPPSISPIRSPDFNEGIRSPLSSQSENKDSPRQTPVEKNDNQSHSNITEKKNNKDAPTNHADSRPTSSQKESSSIKSRDTNEITQILQYENVISGILTHKERIRLINSMRPISSHTFQKVERSKPTIQVSNKNSLNSSSLGSETNDATKKISAVKNDENIVSFSNVQYLSSLLHEEEQLLIELNTCKDKRKSHVNELQSTLSQMTKELEAHNEQLVKKQDDLQKVEEVMSLAVKANHGLLLDIKEKYDREGSDACDNDASIAGKIQNRAEEMQKKKKNMNESGNEGSPFGNRNGMDQFQSHIAFQEQLKSVDSYLSRKTSN